MPDETAARQELGRRLRAAWAYRRDATQTEIAKLLNVSPRTLARMYAGKSRIEEAHIKATLEHTGVPEWFLRHGFEPPPTSEDPDLSERVDALEDQMQTVLRILTGRVASAAASSTGRGGAGEDQRDVP